MNWKTLKSLSTVMADGLTEDGVSVFRFGQKNYNCKRFQKFTSNSADSKVLGTCGPCICQQHVRTDLACEFLTSSLIQN